jgi:sulfatase maturation enzyme AslB (radical SAM superfamily)
MKNIEKFFDNMKEICEDPVDKALALHDPGSAPKPKNKVNVLYITTICNLACDYCYEGKKPEPRTATEQQIIDFFNEIVEREKGLISTVVFMGGEPFMAMKRLQFALDYAMSLKHQFAISIITNGTQLMMYDKKFYDELFTKICTIEISYDGSGQDRRIYGFTKVPATPHVEDSIKYLRDIGVPFKISYTVHRDNVKNLLKDMVTIMEVYKPIQVKWSMACQELSDMGIDYKKLKRDFRPYAEYLYKRYSIIICDILCNLCKLCNKSNFDGHSYLSPTKGIFYGPKETNKKFDAF